ncbi:hypothetical protein QR46_0556 [Giardia duodenalis assemblage B]|uniref:Uncharacterized protein n=2 Tax=Giardia intestinalis TaxID=5741 RepID=A0A132P0G1_GIAIN|nr:hypothetical protein QR46_0556 [Giardia intestinalis assemblage B]
MNSRNRMRSTRQYCFVSKSCNKSFAYALQCYNWTQAFIYSSNCSQILTEDLNIIGIKRKWINKIFYRLSGVINSATIVGIASL